MVLPQSEKPSANTLLDKVFSPGLRTLRCSNLTAATNKYLGLSLNVGQTNLSGPARVEPGLVKSAQEKHPLTESEDTGAKTHEQVRGVESDITILVTQKHQYFSNGGRLKSTLVFKEEDIAESDSQFEKTVDSLKADNITKHVKSNKTVKLKQEYTKMIDHFSPGDKTEYGEICAIPEQPEINESTELPQIRMTVPAERKQITRTESADTRTDKHFKDCRKQRKEDKARLDQAEKAKVHTESSNIFQKMETLLPHGTPLIKQSASSSTEKDLSVRGKSSNSTKPDSVPKSSSSAIKPYNIEQIETFGKPTEQKSKCQARKIQSLPMADNVVEGISVEANKLREDLQKVSGQKAVRHVPVAKKNNCTEAIEGAGKTDMKQRQNTKSNCYKEMLDSWFDATSSPSTPTKTQTKPKTPVVKGENKGESSNKDKETMKNDCVTEETCLKIEYRKHDSKSVFESILHTVGSNKETPDNKTKKSEFTSENRGQNKVGAEKNKAKDLHFSNEISNMEIPENKRESVKKENDNSSGKNVHSDKNKVTSTLTETKKSSEKEEKTRHTTEKETKTYDQALNNAKRKSSTKTQEHFEKKRKMSFSEDRQGERENKPELKQKEKAVKEGNDREADAKDRGTTKGDSETKETNLKKEYKKQEGRSVFEYILDAKFCETTTDNQIENSDLSCQNNNHTKVGGQNTKAEGPQNSRVDRVKENSEYSKGSVKKELAKSVDKNSYSDKTNVTCSHTKAKGSATIEEKDRHATEKETNTCDQALGNTKRKTSTVHQEHSEKKRKMSFSAEVQGEHKNNPLLKQREGAVKVEHKCEAGAKEKVTMKSNSATKNKEHRKQYGRSVFESILDTTDKTANTIDNKTKNIEFTGQNSKYTKGNKAEDNCNVSGVKETPEYGKVSVKKEMAKIVDKNSDKTSDTSVLMEGKVLSEKEEKEKHTTEKETKTSEKTLSNTKRRRSTINQEHLEKKRKKSGSADRHREHGDKPLLSKGDCNIKTKDSPHEEKPTTRNASNHPRDKSKSKEIRSSPSTQNTLACSSGTIPNSRKTETSSRERSRDRFSSDRDGDCTSSKPNNKSSCSANDSVARHEQTNSKHNESSSKVKTSRCTNNAGAERRDVKRDKDLSSGYSKSNENTSQPEKTNNRKRDSSPYQKTSVNRNSPEVEGGRIGRKSDTCYKSNKMSDSMTEPLKTDKRERKTSFDAATDKNSDIPHTSGITPKIKMTATNDNKRARNDKTRLNKETTKCNDVAKVSGKTFSKNYKMYCGKSHSHKKISSPPNTSRQTGTKSSETDCHQKQNCSDINTTTERHNQLKKSVNTKIDDARKTSLDSTEEKNSCLDKLMNKESQNGSKKSVNDKLDEVTKTSLDSIETKTNGTDKRKTTESPNGLKKTENIETNGARKELLDREEEKISCTDKNKTIKGQNLFQKTVNKIYGAKKNTPDCFEEKMSREKTKAELRNEHKSEEYIESTNKTRTDLDNYSQKQDSNFCGNKSTQKTFLRDSNQTQSHPNNKDLEKEDIDDQCRARDVKIESNKRKKTSDDFNVSSNQKQNTVFKCEECQKSFFTKQSDLALHKEKMHKYLSKDLSKEQEQSDKVINDSGVKLSACNISDQANITKSVKKEDNNNTPANKVSKDSAITTEMSTDDEQSRSRISENSAENSTRPKNRENVPVVGKHNDDIASLKHEPPKFDTVKNLALSFTDNNIDKDKDMQLLEKEPSYTERGQDVKKHLADKESALQKRLVEISECDNSISKPVIANNTRNRRRRSHFSQNLARRRRFEHDNDRRQTASKFTRETSSGEGMHKGKQISAFRPPNGGPKCRRCFQTFCSMFALKKHLYTTGHFMKAQT